MRFQGAERPFVSQPGVLAGTDYTPLDMFYLKAGCLNADYPSIRIAIQATVDLVAENPALADVGREILDIAYQQYVTIDDHCN